MVIIKGYNKTLGWIQGTTINATPEDWELAFPTVTNKTLGWIQRTIISTHPGIGSWPSSLQPLNAMNFCS